MFFNTHRKCLNKKMCNFINKFNQIHLYGISCKVIIKDLGQKYRPYERLKKMNLSQCFSPERGSLDSNGLASFVILIYA